MKIFKFITCIVLLEISISCKPGGAPTNERADDYGEEMSVEEAVSELRNIKRIFIEKPRTHEGFNLSIDDETIIYGSIAGGAAGLGAILIGVVAARHRGKRGSSSGGSTNSSSTRVPIDPSDSVSNVRHVPSISPQAGPPVGTTRIGRNTDASGKSVSPSSSTPIASTGDTGGLGLPPPPTNLPPPMNAPKSVPVDADTPVLSASTGASVVSNLPQPMNAASPKKAKPLPSVPSNSTQNPRSVQGRGGNPSVSLNELAEKSASMVRSRNNDKWGIKFRGLDGKEDTVIPVDTFAEDYMKAIKDQVPKLKAGESVVITAPADSDLYKSLQRDLGKTSGDQNFFEYTSGQMGLVNKVKRDLIVEGREVITIRVEEDEVTKILSRQASDKINDLRQKNIDAEAAEAKAKGDDSEPDEWD